MLIKRLKKLIKRSKKLNSIRRVLMQTPSPQILFKFTVMFEIRSTGPSSRGPTPGLAAKPSTFWTGSVGEGWAATCFRPNLTERYCSDCNPGQLTESMSCSKGSCFSTRKVRTVWTNRAPPEVTEGQSARS